MTQRLAVVAFGEPPGYRDAGGQVGRRGRRVCGASQHEIRHEISFDQ
jgi:hypothetical protein